MKSCYFGCIVHTFYQHKYVYEKKHFKNIIDAANLTALHIHCNVINTTFN